MGFYKSTKNTSIRNDLVKEKMPVYYNPVGPGKYTIESDVGKSDLKINKYKN
jgi:hypothetical protein